MSTWHEEVWSGRWSSPDVEADIKALTFTNDAAESLDVGVSYFGVKQLVADIIAVLERHGYDSLDREMAFIFWSDRTGISYDQLYNFWLYSLATA